MKGDQTFQSADVCCTNCGRIVPAYDSVCLGAAEDGYKKLCSECFSHEMARLGGLNAFQHHNFAPVGVADSTGEVHEFHFRSRLFGPKIAVDAFELRDGDPAGYQFQILGHPEDDPLALFQRLLEKIRRALSVKHLRQGELGLQIPDFTVRGRIEWDDRHHDRVPVLVIDGKEITSEDFGRMWMSFEGWQFHLNILDKSEEC